MSPSLIMSELVAAAARMSAISAPDYTTVRQRR